MRDRPAPYAPNPIDTSAVELNPEVQALTERLAQNVHDQWARLRFAEGWKWGPKRDDDHKEHPCLVPYADLPESEKAYDRTTTIEILKAVRALGYDVQVSAPPVVEPSADVELDTRFAADMAGLLALWRGRAEQSALWSCSPKPYRQLAERMLKLGAPFLAAEVVREGLDRWRADIRLRQLNGLAQARCGATEQANRILAELRDEKHADEQTLGILARTHKDLGLLTADPGERQRQLRISRDLYLEAYQQHGGTWTGINGATLSTLLGDHAWAKDLAREISSFCLKQLQELEPGDGDTFWELASLGEAALNLEDWAEAERWYTRAGKGAGKRFGDLNSTRKQAKLLAFHLGQDPACVDRWLPLPCVVVFAGHMIDRPGRPQPRFPARPEVEASVYRAILDWLREQNSLIGYASAACGADILFLEALLELDGEVHVVLPYDPETFQHDSVAIVPGADWAQRFKNVLSRATQIVQASGEKMAAGSVSYDYANLMLHGLAGVRAGELDTSLVGLAVWNGQEGDGPGGTATVVRRWQHLGVPVAHLDLVAAAAGGDPPVVSLPPPPFPPVVDKPADADTCVMAMLFADAVNYSKLTEEQVPRFVQHFLTAIADLMRRQHTAAVVKNTWGDGLYLAFKHLQDAGVFALDLCDLVTRTDWASKGLPKGLSMRIALHAGPVYGCRDPITGNWNYTGTHVSRAARIEPITPPGQVYASQAFAALAAVERVRGFTCEFVKHVEWAKHYGTFPTYHVKRVR